MKFLKKLLAAVSRAKKPPSTREQITSLEQSTNALGGNRRKGTFLQGSKTLEQRFKDLQDIAGHQQKASANLEIITRHLVANSLPDFQLFSPPAPKNHTLYRVVAHAGAGKNSKHPEFIGLTKDKTQLIKVTPGDKQVSISFGFGKPEAVFNVNFENHRGEAMKFSFHDDEAAAKMLAYRRKYAK